MKNHKMKNHKIYALLLLITFSSSLFYQCVPSSTEYRSVETLESNFSAEAENWGNIIASSITNTAKELEKNNIVLSNKNAVNLAAKENTLNVFENLGYLSKKEKSTLLLAKKTSNKQESKTLSEVINSEQDNFSKAQLRILKRIEKARNAATSYRNFSNTLIRINEAIYKNLPKEEQAALITITSSLYYGLEAMNELVNEGVLPGNSENNDVTLAQLNKGVISMAHAQSTESDEEESWWDSWGKCATSIIGGAVTGATTLGLAGAAVGTVALPVVGTVAGGTVGAVGGAVGGALTGAVAGC